MRVKDRSFRAEDKCFEEQGQGKQGLEIVKVRTQIMQTGSQSPNPRLDSLGLLTCNGESMEYYPHCRCFFANDEDPDPLCRCGRPLMCCLDGECTTEASALQRRTLDLFGLAESGYSDYELKILVQMARNPASFD